MGLSKIVLKYDDGSPDTEILVTATQVLFDLFGQRINLNAPKAATVAEFSANPAALDGQSGDLTRTALPQRWYRDDSSVVLLGMYLSWADWFSANFKSLGGTIDANEFPSMLWWKETYKVALNLNNLGPKQRRSMGV